MKTCHTGTENIVKMLNNAYYDSPYYLRDSVVHVDFDFS
jgi:hypothetical protein